MRTVTRAALAATTLALLGAALPTVADATHNGAHATPCNQPGTVGGGALGNSPGPVGPPNSLGWDVGSGQCNGSFSITSDPAFPGGALELGIRAEERRVGQVAPTGVNDYTVQLGNDTNAPPAINRAWWNFQISTAYKGSINSLDALTLAIQTDVGPNLPAAPIVDLLPIRPIIDARNNQTNATTGFADLYQISQNPEFGWFTPTSDTDANPTGAFDYSQPGAWRFTVTATEAGVSQSVSVCIHTPGQSCIPPNADPDCSAAVASQTSLWPPNHQMVAIDVNGVTDPDSDPTTVLIDSIFQDEPVDAIGDGNTGPDGAGVGTATAEVRAERSGSKKNGGNGRVYTISFTASDGQGGSCTGSVTVGVPHDKKSVAVDDGAVYDSTV